MTPSEFGEFRDKTRELQDAAITRLTEMGTDSRLQSHVEAMVALELVNVLHRIENVLLTVVANQIEDRGL